MCPYGWILCPSTYLCVDGCCAVGMSDIKIPPSGCERPFESLEVVPGVLEAVA